MAFNLDTARKIIAAAQQKAGEIKKPVTVCVVDAGGFPLALERMEGARPMTPHFAMAKAYTAAVMQRPSKDLMFWAEHEPVWFAAASSMGHLPIVATKGSATFYENGTAVGGMGVAGGTADEDQSICDTVAAAFGGK